MPNKFIKSYCLFLCCVFHKSLLKLPEIWCRCNFQSKTSHVGDAIGEKKEHTDDFSNFIQVADQENNLNGRKGNTVNNSSVLADLVENGNSQ